MAIRYKQRCPFSEDSFILTHKQSNAAYEPKLKTGIKTLDRDNYGGLNRSGPVVISGQAGSGKTTLTDQILSLNAGTKFFEPEFAEDGRPAKDENGKPIGKWKQHHAIIIQGEAGGGRVAYTMYRQLAGRLVSSDPTPDGKNRYYIDKSVHDRIFNQIGEDSVFMDIPYGVEHPYAYMKQKCEWYVENASVDIFFFDNYATICGSIMGRDTDTMNLTDNQKQTLLAAWLEDFCLRHHVWVIVVAHVRKEGTASSNAMDKTSGSSNITNLAGMVLDFIKPDQEKDGNTENTRIIKVVKNREFKCNYDGYRMDFDDKSQRIFEEGDKQFATMAFPWENAEQEEAKKGMWVETGLTEELKSTDDWKEIEEELKSITDATEPGVIRLPGRYDVEVIYCAFGPKYLVKYDGQETQVDTLEGIASFVQSIHQKKSNDLSFLDSEEFKKEFGM